MHELQTEIALFLREKKSRLADKFDDPIFIMHVAYLADIFRALNTLNQGMQGRATTLIEASERLRAFQAKLILWQKRLHARNFANFTLLDEHDEVHDEGVNAAMQHLGTLL